MRSSTIRIMASLLAVALTACSSATAEVTGTVTKLDRMALTPDTVVIVELRDTSRQDVAAVTLDEQRIELGGDQLPVPYVLEYDEGEIEDTNTYVVFARVEAGGELLYITDTAYPVITRGASTADVEVLVVPAG